MNGTVRVFDRELWQTLPGRFERFVRGIAQAFGCEIEIKYQRHNGPTINDPKMAALARTVAVSARRSSALRRCRRLRSHRLIRTRRACQPVT